MVTPIRFINRLSVRLTRYSVLLAFTIGVFLSLLQVLYDFYEQEEAIDASIAQILRVATPPATRAVETLDKSLAEELITGLKLYEYIEAAAIYDDLKQTLAETRREYLPSQTLWITKSLTGTKKTYEVELIIAHYNDDETGVLALSINMDAALGPFYERAFNVLVSGILRNFLLLMALLFLYFKMLTKPLEHLAAQFSNLRPSSTRKQTLHIPRQHRNNELGLLADTGNQFLSLVRELISEKEAASEALKISEARLNRLIQALPQLVFILDKKGQVLFANTTFASFYGMHPQEYKDKKFVELHQHNVYEAETITKYCNEVFISETPKLIEDLNLTTPTQERTPYTLVISFMDYMETDSVLVVATNISEQKKTQEKIAKLANEDNLTGLPSRNLLLQKLEQQLRKAKSHQASGALLFIDLDHFKNINDSLGHDIGDKLLQAVAEKLKNLISENGIVARFGGDEFVVLQGSDFDKRGDVRSSASLLSENIIDAFREPLLVAGRPLHIGMSIGVVLFPENDSNKEDLLRYADIAMYKAKANGRNCFWFYEGAMSKEVELLHDLESELRTALSKNQFELYYQPQVSAEGSLLGLEALIRWNHPNRGTVSPGEFIPILESNGQIVAVSNWVLTEACRQLNKWQEQGYWKNEATLSVNISPYQFYLPDFVEQTHKIITTHNLPCKFICLEVTESIAIDSISYAAKRLDEIREIGLKVALDDFGTGYSSMAYIKDLPIDVVKIDRSFIKDLANGQKQDVIIEAILTMAQGLGMDVVAEGVEGPEQLNFLVEKGCGRYQGYHFCRPVTAKEIEKQYFLNKSSS